jgi:hypothetical protein
LVAATLSSLPARKGKWNSAAPAREDPVSLVTERVRAPSSPERRTVSRTSLLSPDWLMPITRTSSSLISPPYRVKTDGEARAVGTPRTTSKRYLA